MPEYVEDSLRRVRAHLAAIVLIAEDGEAAVTPAACIELERIEAYLARIAAKANLQEVS